MAAATSANKKIVAALITIAAAVFIAQWSTLRWELPVKPASFCRWWVHHDEKLIIPDARYMHLKGSQEISLLDYKPYPVSAAFGVAGPALAASGFSLFGFGNTGLRSFFVFIAFAGTIFYILSLMKLSPGIVGASFCLIYIACQNNILLHRHAILENILTFLLLAITWFLVRRRDFLVKHLPIFAFGAGITVLFKENFVIIVYMYLFLIGLIERLGARRLLMTVIGGVCGLIFFEGLQSLYLWHLGILPYRAQSFFAAALLHRGFNPVISGNVVHGLQPSGLLHTFLRFPVIAADWYHVNMAFVPRLWLAEIAIGLPFLLFITYAIIFGFMKKISREALIIALFIAAYIIFSSQFFFYPKRAVSVIPLLLIIIAQCIEGSLQALRKRGAPALAGFLGVIFFLGALSYAAAQVPSLVDTYRSKTSGIERNSLALDKDLPGDEPVYAQCYAYRAFWQSRRHRLMSGDDQVLNDEDILRWAHDAQARYALLSAAGGCTPRMLSPFKIINTYTVSSSDADQGDTFYLVEMKPAA